MKKVDFDRSLDCAAPKSWSKYLTEGRGLNGHSMLAAPGVQPVKMIQNICLLQRGFTTDSNFIWAIKYFLAESKKL